VVSSDGVTTDLHHGFILQYGLTQLVVVINLVIKPRLNNIRFISCINMGDQDDKVVVKPEGVATLMPACVVCTYQCNKVHGDVHRQAEKYDPDRTWPYFIKGVRRSSLADAAPSLLVNGYI
jgi:hypothetical protein